MVNRLANSESGSLVPWIVTCTACVLRIFRNHQAKARVPDDSHHVPGVAVLPNRSWVDAAGIAASCGQLRTITGQLRGSCAAKGIEKALQN